MDNCRTRRGVSNSIPGQVGIGGREPRRTIASRATSTLGCIANPAGKLTGNLKVAGPQTPRPAQSAEFIPGGLEGM